MSSSPNKRTLTQMMEGASLSSTGSDYITRGDYTTGSDYTTRGDYTTQHMKKRRNAICVGNVKNVPLYSLGDGETALVLKISKDALAQLMSAYQRKS